MSKLLNFNQNPALIDDDAMELRRALAHVIQAVDQLSGFEKQIWKLLDATKSVSAEEIELLLHLQKHNVTDGACALNKAAECLSGVIGNVCAQRLAK